MREYQIGNWGNCKRLSDASTGGRRGVFRNVGQKIGMHRRGKMV